MLRQRRVRVWSVLAVSVLLWPAVGATASAASVPSAPIGVRTFPVAGGQGITWKAAPANGLSFHVYGLVSDAWVDLSGPVAQPDGTFVDTTLEAGATRSYRVTAEYAGSEGPASSPVSATRPSVDPTAGAVSAVSVDVDPGSRTQPGDRRDRLVTDLSLTPGGEDPTSGSAIMTAFQGGGVTVAFPARLPGPGRYDLTPSPSSSGWLDVSTSEGYCWYGTSRRVLVVDEVSYTADGGLDLFTGRYELTCSDEPPMYGDIRWRSTHPVNALSASPVSTDLTTAAVGSAAPTSVVTLTNIGGVDQTLGARVFLGDAAADWSVVRDECGSSLPAGGSCDIEVGATPTRTGDRSAFLEVGDSTVRGLRHVRLNLSAATVATAPLGVAATRLPFGSVDLSWTPPVDDGNAVFVGYVVHRTVGDADTVFRTTTTEWVDGDAPVGATYSVAMENSVGEGAPSVAVVPTPSRDVLLANANTKEGDPWRFSAIAVPGGRQPVQWSTPGLPEYAFAADVSPDGLEVVTSRASTGGTTVWRQPLDGSAAPVALFSSSRRVVDLRWSPDGTRVAVQTTPMDNCCPKDLRMLDAATGNQLWVVEGLENASWLPDARTLVASSTGTPGFGRVDGATGRSLGTFPGVPSATNPSVSPDGRWMAFSAWDSHGDQHTYVVPASGGTPRQVPGLGFVARAAWAADGAGFVVATLRDGVLHRVPVADDGTPGDPVDVPLSPSANVSDVMVWGGPRVALGAFPAVNGAVVRVPVDARALPGGSTFTCSVDAAPFTACSTPFSTPTLRTGSHTVRVRAQEPGGRVTLAARTFTTDATAPVAAVAAQPVALLGTAATLRYSATDSGGGAVASYDVRYRYAAPTGTFGAYSQPAGWQSMRSTSLALRLSVGYSYCFSVRGRDSVGNVGAWTSETCSNVALDDRSLSGTGWVRGTSAAYYAGTYTTTATSARVLGGRASARQVGLVVTTCSTCGTVDVRLGGVLLGRVSTATSTTRAKQVLWLPAGVVRTGSLSITTVGSRRVYVDGLVVRH